MAEQVNFELIRGTAPLLRFQLTNPEVLQDNPADWTTLFTVRKKDTSANATLSITGNLSSVPNANVYGIFDVVVSAANTTLLTDGSKYAYSFRRTDSGNEDVLTWGEITVRTVA